MASVFLCILYTEGQFRRNNAEAPVSVQEKLYDDVHNLCTTLGSFGKGTKLYGIERDAINKPFPTKF